MVYIKNLKLRLFKKDKKNDLALIKITDSEFMPLKSLPYDINTEISSLGSNVFFFRISIMDVIGETVKYSSGNISSINGIK